ncbi:MAG TPA: DUF5107 domain-containing protein, partial [Terracidiphilus sp.]|nr:DUF5107 domain-containing protein [Terracidiphilus sp.]
MADHARRAITEFPLSHGTYYGIDYGKRAAQGVPPEEQPSQYVPDGSCAANDLSWYANIPVPTSYMVVGSKGDFAGGYDHAREAGVVYIANHHIAPGKKQWTWGNHDFGYAWDRSLTEADGPYIELMAGAYTDNQPDFSFLAPGETKTFSQFWYPIQKIGVPDHATLDAALRLERIGDRLLVHLITTRELPHATLQVETRDAVLASRCETLQTQVPLCVEFPLPAALEDFAVTLSCAGEQILRYAPAEIVPVGEPKVATEPPQPKEVSSSDELYLIGMHLEQYRHATRSPEPYWREALRRDPRDSRATCALGRWHLRRGELAAAEPLLRASIARATERNPNPYDGEPYYNLGLVLLLQQRAAAAYEAFYKATWNAAWKAPAYHRLAEIDCGNAAWIPALDHIDRSLRADADNLNARNLKTMILGRLGRTEDARQFLAATRALDPLDIWSRFLAEGQAPQDEQLRLDLAFDLARAGMLSEAKNVLTAPRAEANDGSDAMLLYALGLVCAQAGQRVECANAFRRAAAASPDYVFPSRLEEMLALEQAIRENPQDARARYYLGNLLYDRRRHAEAIECWEAATALNPHFATVWRNLGFGYFNVRHDAENARRAFEQARRLAPDDARILYEHDQLEKRTGQSPERRLANLKAAHVHVERRDDLTLEYASLCNLTGQPSEALHVLLKRKFQPWEGGEGLVLAEFTRAHLSLGQQALQQGKLSDALVHFRACVHPPRNLGEAWHLLANRSQIEFWTGLACAAIGQHPEARAQWSHAARRDRDIVQ